MVTQLKSSFPGKEMNQPRVVAKKAVCRQEPRVPILERPKVTEIPYKKGNKKVPRNRRFGKRNGQNLGKTPEFPSLKSDLTNVRVKSSTI